MKCQYCNSMIVPVPANGICPNCGGVLEVAGCDTERMAFPEPPVGIYKDVAGHLEITQDSITFYRNQWPIMKSTKTIAFRDIYAVSYVEAGPGMSGSLCVRQWEDRNVPLVSGGNAVLDKTSVYFRKGKNQIFYQVYLFLEQCARIVKAAKDGAQDKEKELIGRHTSACGYMDIEENVTDPNCDGAAGKEVRRDSSKLIFPKAPVGMYVDLTGDYIEITDSYIKIRKDVPLGEDDVTEIPFCDIYDARFDAGSYFRNGFLCVRKLEDKEKPMPVKYSQAKKDKTTIVLSAINNERFYPIYRFLKKCADIVNGIE